MRKEEGAVYAKVRSWLLLTTGLVGFGLAASSIALAQSGDVSDLKKNTKPVNAPPTGKLTGAGSNGAAVAPGKLEEVVVTAEKRKNTVQRTSATIEVVSSATLQRQHVVELTDLNKVLTDTQIVPVVAGTQVTIRGIGSNFLDPRADPAVATSLNGLYFDRPLPLGFGFLDVSRVEDLEGPQGTLYGRNAAAGALNIITNQPKQSLGGSLQVSGGDYGYNEVTGVLNVPIGDQLALRGAFDYDRRNGYIGGYYDDVNNNTGRLSARWTPTDQLSIYAETDYTQIGGHGGFSEAYPCAGAVPWSLFIPRNCPPASIIASGEAPKTGTEGSFVDSDQINVSYDFGAVTLTSISGFVGTHERLNNSPDGTYFNQTDRTNSYDYSEEIRLAGNDRANHQGGLAWQVGTYIFDSHGNYFFHTQANQSVSPFAGLLSGTTIFNKIPQSSEAVYAQATYGVTDRLRLIGGVRYTHDDKGIDSQAFSYQFFTFTVPGPISAGEASAVSDHFNYRVGAEYDLAPRSLVYATVSSGYVAGGANGGSSSAPLLPFVQPAVFKPETITAYEIGSKNRFLDDRLQINGDFYYYNFHDYQYLYTSEVQGGGSFYELEVQNVAPLTSYGVESSVDFAITPSDRVSASVAYTQANFGEIRLDSFPPPFGPEETITVTAGSALPNVPRWSGLLGYDHTFRIDDDQFLVFSVNTKLSTKYLVVIGSQDPYDTQSGYTMTDVSLAYHLAHDKYIIRGFATNLENSAVNVYGQGQLFHLYGIEPPRMFGVSISASF